MSCCFKVFHKSKYHMLTCFLITNQNSWIHNTFYYTIIYMSYFLYHLSYLSLFGNVEKDESNTNYVFSRNYSRKNNKTQTFLYLKIYTWITYYSQNLQIVLKIYANCYLLNVLQNPRWRKTTSHLKQHFLWICQ